MLEARDGHDALSIAHEYSKEIHMLITDVVMPGLSGRHLADRLSHLRPHIRVLYSSGYAEGITMNAGVEGRLPLLAKPYPPAELLYRVREILDGNA
ncbi:MAG: response regulator [Acidobacteria bacterium]|nr:response regulator [Acidobacteriota bacterium]